MDDGCSRSFEVLCCCVSREVHTQAHVGVCLNIRTQAAVGGLRHGHPVEMRIGPRASECDPTCGWGSRRRESRWTREGQRLGFVAAGKPRARGGRPELG